MFSLLLARVSFWTNCRVVGGLRPWPWRSFDVTVMATDQNCQRDIARSVCITSLNSLRPRRNEQHFADDIFKRIFFNENVWISIKISLKFVPKGPINNIPALVPIMAWRRSGDKPLSEAMMVGLLTHICVTRPQWVNSLDPGWCCSNLNV